MALGRNLKMGMIGGGPGAFIGDVHRKASRLDGRLMPLSARPFAPSGRGSTTATSKKPRIPESTTTPAANNANNVTG